MINSTYIKNNNVVKRIVAGETILVPIRGKLADLQRVHILEGIADLIWDRLDGKTPLSAIRDELAATFDKQPHTIEQDIQDFLTSAKAAGLITETPL